MAGAAHDEDFEARLRTVVERHAIASRLRDVGQAAEEALVAALRVGDAVRRAVRAGAARPDAEDCAALDRLASGLGDALARAAGAPCAAALRAAIAEKRAADAARLAAQVFLDAAPPGELPPAVYRGVTVRRRTDGGESLIRPEDLAAELARASRAGIAVVGAHAPALPEALALAPSFAACGTEIALARRTDDLRDILLEDAASGDLLCFTALPGPFAVALAQSADDEWWAASPLGYAAYRARLRAALEPLGIVVEAGA